MASINNPTYTQLLEVYKEALYAIAVAGQSYQIGPRTFTRADLKDIRETIEWLEHQVARDSDASGGFGVSTLRGAV